MTENEQLIEDGIFDKTPEYVDEVEISAEPDEITIWNYILDILFNPIFGWSLVILVVLIVLFWNKLHRYLDQLYIKREQLQYDAKCHKDPDWVMSNFEKMENARKKMQEKYNSDAAQFKIKQAEREEKKRLEKLANLSALETGNVLGRKNPKSDYNPLDGDTSRGYRPSKKNKCAGGGCG